MADVIRKAIAANDIVQGAAVIMTVSPSKGDSIGDKHQDVNPNNTDAVDVDSVTTKYTGRFKS